MGRFHIRALSETKSVKLTAVVEPDATTRLEVQAMRFETYASVAQLVGASVADAAVIAAPTPFHLELVRELVAGGLAILCEKPCGASSFETTEAARLAAEAEIVLRIGYWRRFVPDLIALRERIRGGTYGELTHLTCWQWDERTPSASFREVSGGIMVDMAVHELDQTRWLTGRELLDIVAVPGEIASQEALRDYPTSAQIGISLSGGAIASISLGSPFAYGDCCWVDVIGTHGYERIPFMWGDGGSSHFRSALISQAEAFVDAVHGDDALGATGADAIAAIQAAESAAASLGERISRANVRTDME